MYNTYNVVMLNLCILCILKGVLINVCYSHDTNIVFVSNMFLYLILIKGAFFHINRQYVICFVLMRNVL